ncbi:MAG: HAD family hydrolase [Anaerolineales bacterium]
MIKISIPGRGELTLEHLVMDVNGTLALDGLLLEGVAPRINRLRDRLTIHLLTADTHGGQAAIDHLLNLTAVRVHPGGESAQKAEYVQHLGPEKTAAIGQGANDAAMLKSAALGLCLLSTEGLAIETLLAADLLFPDILSALDVFESPRRLIASLRQ